MSDLLTLLFVATTAVFALLFVLDFAFGLIVLWDKTTRITIAPQLAILLPTVLEPITPQKIATLDWIVPQELEESFDPIDVIALAKSRFPSLDITALKIYKLRGESVVKVQDVCISIPTHIKRYKLRGVDVIKLAQLEQLAIA